MAIKVSFMSFVCSAFAAAFTFADMTVSGVAARQHWPRDNKVDVDDPLVVTGPDVRNGRGTVSYEYGA